MMMARLISYMEKILLMVKYMTSIMRKPVSEVSDQFQHKLDCTAKENGWTLEIADLESRGIILSL